MKIRILGGRENHRSSGENYKRDGEVMWCWMMINTCLSWLIS